MYSVLALDLATTTGWSVWKTGQERPFWGAKRLPGSPQEVGKRIEHLRLLITDLHKAYQFTDIIFEAQHIGAKINIDTVYLLIGLGSFVEWIAHRMEIRCMKCHISEWRKHFIGRGAGFGKQDPKAMAMAKAEEFGWFIDQPDAAEACGILDYYLSLLSKADRRLVVPWRDQAMFQTPGKLL